MKRPISERIPLWFCIVLAVVVTPGIVLGLMWHMMTSDGYVPLTRAERTQP